MQHWHVVGTWTSGLLQCVSDGVFEMSFWEARKSFINWNPCLFSATPWQPIMLQKRLVAWRRKRNTVSLSACLRLRKHGSSKIIETELIECHLRTLVDMERSGFAGLLKDVSKTLELQQMYDLFVRVPSSVDFLRRHAL